MRFAVCGLVLAQVAIALAKETVSPSPAPKSPVDSLIPWLLQENQELRGIPFSEVIFDATGKKVIAVDKTNETDQRVIKQISGVLDEVVRRMNGPESRIQGIARINEVSSHFEDMLRELLNATPGLSCDIPHTAAGGVQRSGYPDLRSSILNRNASSTSTRSFMPSEVVRAVSAHSISSRKLPPTRCSMTPSTSSSVSSMRSAAAIIGTSRAGTWSISRSSK